MDDEARRADSQTDSNQAVVEREVLFSKFMKLKKDLAQVESTIKAMNEDYTRNITRLQLQKQSLEQAMSHLKALLEFEGYQVEEKSSTAEAIGKQDQQPVSIRDAAYELMREVHHPMHYKELALRLKERDVLIPGKSPEATLLARISRDKRFRRTKRRGVYTLASPSSILLRKRKSRRR